jgi:hypothetical protein
LLCIIPFFLNWVGNSFIIILQYRGATLLAVGRTTLVAVRMRAGYAAPVFGNELEQAGEHTAYHGYYG